jgi:uncharacterized protein (DUF427 family)
VSKSPGHQQHPDHKVNEERLPQAMTVDVGGEIVAASSDVIRVDEDKAPPRFYFPRTDVRMDALERTETTTRCPYKGTANYFSLTLGPKTLKDAVWTYEDPYDEHPDLKNRLAFHDDKFPDIHVQSKA